MRGQMMDLPLTIPSVLEFAARFHGGVEVVTRTVEGPIHRYDYAALARRTASLAHALKGLGVAEGQVLGTLAWNTYRHLELYYAIPGLGAVCHTINPRLSHDDIAYIIGHADDGLIFVDPGFLPIVAAIAPRVQLQRDGPIHRLRRRVGEIDHHHAIQPRDEVVTLHL